LHPETFYGAVKMVCFYSSVYFTIVKVFAVMLNRNTTQTMLVIPVLYRTFTLRRLDNRKQSNSKGTNTTDFITRETRRVFSG